MSAKSSPWENAYQESFYSQFKVDLGRTDRFNELGELIEAISKGFFFITILKNSYNSENANGRIQKKISEMNSPSEIGYLTNTSVRYLI